MVNFADSSSPSSSHLATMFFCEAKTSRLMPTKVFAVSCATSIKWRAGTTRSTSPMARASGAFTVSPVSSRRRARPNPMVGGSSEASITDGIPTCTSGSPKMASSAAMRISQASISSSAPPKHGPRMAATAGMDIVSSFLAGPCSAVMNASASAGSRSFI